MKNNNNKRINLILISIAAMIGYAAFSANHPVLQGLMILIPALWVHTRTRIAGGLVLAVYMLVVSRGIPEAAYNFFGYGWLLGILLLTIVTAVFFAFGYVLWRDNEYQRLFIAPAIALLWLLPPIAFISWGNPLLSAGWLFPGWHWYGLALTFVLPLLLARFPQATALLLIALIFNAMNYQPIQPDKSWIAHDTQYHYGINTFKPDRNLLEEYDRHQDLIAQVRQSAKLTPTVHLLPEGLGGIWNESTARLWQQGITKNQTVLINAYQESDNGYTSQVLAVTKEVIKTIYTQRMTVPAAMWKPWSDENIHPVFSEIVSKKPLNQINGKHVDILICYENLLLWPALHSLLKKPDILLSQASVWWSPDYITAAEKHGLESLSQLFGIPTLKAINY